LEILEDTKPVTSYPIMEHFYSVQGEGFYQGTPAYFIRLGGCDVGCVWCDVKESWDAGKHPKMTVDEIISEVKKTKTEFVVITGGEPLMYDCSALTKALRALDLQVALETSGAYELTGNWTWICVSPKKFKVPLPSVLAQADELKVVVFNKSDFEWAEEHRQNASKNCALFLQPEWSKEKEMAANIIDYIQRNPAWSVSLQIHKYLDLR
jgi:organic radical activating enzyme